MTTNINNSTKKKVLDARVPSLIRNGVDTRERSFIIMVGDKSRNQIPNLHYLMMNANLKMNKSILWAYKKKLLGFSSHRLNREKKIKKDIKRGTREANDLDRSRKKLMKYKLSIFNRYSMYICIIYKKY